MVSVNGVNHSHFRECSYSKGAKYETSDFKRSTRAHTAGDLRRDIHGAAGGRDDLFQKYLGLYQHGSQPCKAFLHRLRHRVFAGTHPAQDGEKDTPPAAV